MQPRGIDWLFKSEVVGTGPVDRYSAPDLINDVNDSAPLQVNYMA